jgi:hypothetical protein
MGNHQIVDDAAIRVCKKRVTLPPSRKPDDIDWNKALERRCNIGQLPVAWPQRDLTHMRDVEQTCMGARVKVLLHNARRILNWHFVTREGTHACTPHNVQIVKWRAFERSVLSGGGRSHRMTLRLSWNAHANEIAPLKGCVPPKALVCEWLLGNGGNGHPIGSNRSCGAPSVFLPENVIPSADAKHLLQERHASFQSLLHCAVRLPESFRGGCSFGAGSTPVSPATTQNRVYTQLIRQSSGFVTSVK